METLDELIATLDSEDRNAAEEAQVALIGTSKSGVAVLPKLLDSAQQFRRFGLLCTIDVIEGIAEFGKTGELNHPAATGVGAFLSLMLTNEDSTVREWAAISAGGLRLQETVEAIRDAWQQSKQRNDPPGWSEPTAYRNALSELGAREIVLPVLAFETRLQMSPFGYCWKSEDLLPVLSAFNEADQIITGVQYYRRSDNSGYRLDNRKDWPTGSNAIDDWNKIVRAQAEEIAKTPVPPIDVYTTIEWIDRTDI